MTTPPMIETVGVVEVGVTFVEGFAPVLHIDGVGVPLECPYKTAAAFVAALKRLQIETARIVYVTGHKAGYQRGHKAGSRDGYREGYDRGYDDGSWEWEDDDGD